MGCGGRSPRAGRGRERRTAGRGTRAASTLDRRSVPAHRIVGNGGQPRGGGPLPRRCWTRRGNRGCKGRQGDAAPGGAPGAYRRGRGAGREADGQAPAGRRAEAGSRTLRGPHKHPFLRQHEGCGRVPVLALPLLGGRLRRCPPRLPFQGREDPGRGGLQGGEVEGADLHLIPGAWH